MAEIGRYLLEAGPVSRLGPALVLLLPPLFQLIPDLLLDRTGRCQQTSLLGGFTHLHIDGDPGEPRVEPFQPEGDDGQKTGHERRSQTW